MDTDANPDNGAPEPSAAPPNPDPRRCNYLRDTGEHCQGWRYKGSAEGHCAGHARVGIAGDPALQALGNAASAAVRSERRETRKLSVLDVLAREVQAKAEDLAHSYVKAAQDGDWRAADALVTRVYGKPKETVETITTGALDTLTDEQLEARAQELRARMHAVDTSVQAA